MSEQRRRGDRNFAAIITFAGLLIAGGAAPGCDDVTARSFGGNVAEPDGGAISLPDGGLTRGQGGAIAISVSSGGAAGRAEATGGAGGASTPAPATGGVGGTASTAPSSTTGSGGGVATGGALGSGGVTTGSAGAPGPVSAGGTPAAGGRGGTPGAPAPGTGGTAPPAGAGGMTPPNGGDQGPDDTCANLIADYDDAVTKAKSCNNSKGKGSSPCAKAVPAKLSGCGAACSTFVDDDTMVTMVQQKWAKAGCVPESCAVSLCISPTGASCSGDDKGTCTDSVLGI